MVAYLQKSEGSKGFHQIIDFLNACHTQTATAGTSANREVELTATIDRQVKTITEASLRRHLKLEDNGGVTTLPNSEIFEKLALMGVYLLRRDEGSLLHNELTDLCTSLSNKVKSLETELKDTKQTYNSALTQLIRWVKKLEHIVKASKSRRRVRVVEYDNEEELEDPSKQGRSLIEELDMDAEISLVPPHAVDEGRNDDTQIYDLPAEQLGVFSTATSLADEAKRRRSVKTTQTYTRRRRSISTRSGRVSTASRTVSTADPPKKVKKRVQVQKSMDEELAKKVYKEEQAKAMAEQEQERINFEAALELQK
ncbi:hypothetical protein Tco_0889457 [Tanacetum coccineum]